MPDVELVSISKDAEVVIAFSKEMTFRPELILQSPEPEELSSDETTKARTMQDQGDAITVDSLFTVQMMSANNEIVDPNLTSWRVSSVTSKEIKIALTFAEVLEVS